MPKGPRGEKRPADVIGRAIMVAKIATGEIDEPSSHTHGKDPAAVALGRKGGLRGGHARATALSKARRSAIAKKAAASRWNKKI